MKDGQKSSYERSLKVTAIFRQYNEQTQFTFEQFKKREDVFKLVVIAEDGLFELGDIVALKITKVMNAMVH